jgi:RNA polymerase sigma-B factor
MFSPPEGEEEWIRNAFERLSESHDPQLRDEIVTRTNWLALRAARHFATRGEPFDDLLQVALIGLLKAVDRFDTTLGVQFGAFATPTIMGELRRHFRDHTWSLHVPRRAKDLRPAVNEAVDQLTTRLHRSPQITEIAAEIGATEEAVHEAMEANHAYRPFALDTSTIELAVSQPKELDHVIDREAVLALLSTLGERERTILYLRYFEEMTQSQIAERVGTSQVHVGRLIASSLTTLRDRLNGEEMDLVPAECDPST